MGEIRDLPPVDSPLRLCYIRPAEAVMSKPIPKEGIPLVSPEERLRELAAPSREGPGAEAIGRFGAHWEALGLRFAGES
jgi:hypothetical protein